MDAEAGHILPTFKIADNFKEVGHTIFYITIEEKHSLIVKNGYENLVIFPNENIKTPLIDDKKRSSEYSLSILDGSLDYLIEEKKPTLIVASLFLPWKAFFLSLKYKIPLFMVYGAPELKILKRGVLNQFKDFLEGDFIHFSGSAPLRIHEFIKEKCPNFNQTKIDQCVEYYFLYYFPLDILIGNIAIDERTFFIGPHIRPIKEYDVSLTKILDSLKEKKIIYASLGSQAHLYEGGIKFYELLLRVMSHEQMTSFHLILSINNELKIQLNFEKVPSNISMLNWVNQLQVLENTQVFITHGGRGSIKEAIATGVPMLVAPMGRDQHENATLIQEKKLGYKVDINQITSEQLIDRIIALENNDMIRANLKMTNQQFTEQEGLKIEIELLNKLFFDSYTI